MSVEVVVEITETIEFLILTLLCFQVLSFLAGSAMVIYSLIALILNIVTLWFNKAMLSVVVLIVGLTIVALDYDFILLPQRVYNLLMTHFAFLFRPYGRSNVTLFFGILIGSECVFNL